MHYVMIGNRKCAQFNSDIDISNLKLPVELEGEYQCSAKGTSVFYFDVSTRSFISGSIAFNLHMYIDAPAPVFELPDEDLKDMPKRSKMSSNSFNFIHLDLKKEIKKNVKQKSINKE